jgi:hypothetical protein
MKDARLHIRYLGFETGPTGRRLEYTITSTTRAPRHAAVEIPFEAFTGPQHLTFQDAAIVGSERLRAELELESDSNSGSLNLILALEDVGRFRPRRRAATKRA